MTATTPEAARVRPRARNIGILYADESGRGLTHPFFSLILNAFREATSARDYDITFLTDASFRAFEGGEEAGRRDVDGLFVVCVDFEDPAVIRLATSGLPCVTLDHIYKRVPAVLSDNETGLQKLVEYAIARGHRSIAFIHDRMPLMLPAQCVNEWIRPDAKPESILDAALTEMAYEKAE